MQVQVNTPYPHTACVVTWHEEQIELAYKVAAAAAQRVACCIDRHNKYKQGKHLVAAVNTVWGMIMAAKVFNLMKARLGIPSSAYRVCQPKAR